MIEQRALKFPDVAIFIAAYQTVAALVVLSQPISGATFWYPPVGIGMVALLLYGGRAAILVFLCDFAVTEFQYQLGHGTALIIAASTTLECLLFYGLHCRIRAKQSAFDLKTYLSYFAGVCLATGAGALIGTLLLLAIGEQLNKSFAEQLGTWWIGDLTGAVGIVFAVLVFAAQREERDSRRLSAYWKDYRLVPLYLGALAVLVFAAFFDFSDLLLSSMGGQDAAPRFDYGFGYLIVVPLVWAAWRYDAAVTALLGLCLNIMVSLTLFVHARYGPTYGANSLHDIFNVQMMLLSTNLVGTGISMAIRDERRARAAERAARDAVQSSANALTQTRNMLDEKHRLLEIASEAGRLGGWSADPVTGRVIWSDEVARIHGMPPGFSPPIEQAIAFYAREDRERISQLFAACARDGTPFDGEFQIIAADGRRVWARAVGRAVRDANGAVVAVQGAFQDITLRKQAEQALAASQRQTRLILESVGEGIQGIDTQGRIIFENRAATTLLGYEYEEMVGCDIHSLVHHHRADGRDYPATQCPIYQTTRDGRTREVVDEVFFRKDGASIPVEYVCSPILDESGAISGTVVSFRDMSERHVAQAKILRLSRVHALLSQITAAIVHVRDQQQLFEEACRIAVHTGGLRGAWIGLIDAAGLAVPVAQAGDIAGYLEGIRISTGAAAEGKGPFGTAIREARNIVCNDIENDPAFAPWRGPALQRGFRSVAVFPLRPAGKVFGAYVLYADSRGFFDAEEMKLLDGLASDIAFAVEFTHQEGRRLQVEAALRDSEEKYRGMIMLSPDAITIHQDGRWVFANPAAARILGLGEPDKMVSKSLLDFMHPDIHQLVATRWEQLYQKRQPVPPEVLKMVRADGQLVYLETFATPIMWEGRPAAQVVARDVTERRALEEQLRQSQRLEAVGQLTGGVAHDFNNLLTVILGNAELLEEELAGDARHRPLAQMIAGAAQRGAELTSRLLAFSRKQALDPKPTEVNRLVAEMDGLLRRSLGEHVEIEVVRGGGLWEALVDAPQLESAVLNLAINARDAMAQGGRLTIETANTRLDDAYAAQHADVVAGQYVMLAVSDTGTGIAPEHLPRVFEPFFTTKEKGKGTGLGLAMVYGFIKQSGGHVSIYSEPGHGTTVKLYLPRVEAQTRAREEVRPEAQAGGGHETILLVEDDALVRTYALGQLRALGYDVIEAQDGPQALQIIAQRADIDLLFTDVVMPGGMSGRQLADEARRLRPTLKVLYTSGYTENAIVHQGRLDPGVHLLSKPYRRAELAKKIREALTQEDEA